MEVLEYQLATRSGDIFLYFFFLGADKLIKIAGQKKMKKGTPPPWTNQWQRQCQLASCVSCSCDQTKWPREECNNFKSYL